MTEIPSPDDIRKIQDLDLLDEKYQADWLEYTLKSVAKFLTDNAHTLQSREMVRYEFDGVLFGDRDKNKPNRYERLWAKRYPEIIALLIDKGYFCEVDDFEQPVSLIIALETQIWTLDAPPSRSQRLLLEEEARKSEKPWWQFW